MPEQIQPDDSHFVAEYATVQSIFIRQRNCLLLRADFTPLFVGYYLHLMQHGLRNAEAEDSLFKELLAFVTLYLVSRPWKEHHAWTCNVPGERPTNYFVAGSSLTEDVVGRIFTENVRKEETGMLYAQNICANRDTHTSVISLPGAEVERWIEEFFQHSEQRQARAFRCRGDEYALVTAEPGADFDWLTELTADQVANIDNTEQIKQLETRRFTFRCGCSAERILPTIRAMQKDFADLLSEQGIVRVSCPRCGAHYDITTEMLTGTNTGPDHCH